MNQQTVGSLWNRWDPHIHAPGTLLNNQYGENAWDEYLTRIEASEPRIRALGITDYYSLETYEEVLRHKSSGRLPDVDFIFPNIELRYSIGTSADKAVNVHLLVSPEDPDHVKELKRFLRALTFDAHDDSYHCEPDDLERLGRRHAPNTTDARTALSVGANQFKVSFEQVKQLWNRSEWIRSNALVAVAGSNRDGSAGLQDASLATLRKEVEKFAHIIFASQPKQRSFWLGTGPVSLGELAESWGGTKPCMHGSDAHALDKVGNPDLDRFTWIKGDLTFEGLRQACLEPGARAFIGEAAPAAGLDSQSIRTIKVANAPWFTPSEMQLNPGLVAIIGARGSGKTALADIIAAGGLISPTDQSEKSFLHRARKLVGAASTTLDWGAGESTTSSLKPDKSPDVQHPEGSPRVQYLSQQFVEKLCSAEGVSGELLREIERVVFQALPVDKRIGSTSFDELLKLKTNAARDTRTQNETALDETSRRINSDHKQKDSLDALKLRRKELNDSLVLDRNTRNAFITNGDASNSARLEELSEAADSLNRKLDACQRRLQAASDLQREVEDLRQNRLPRMLEAIKERHAAANLTEDDWSKFGLTFVGDVDALLENHIGFLTREATELTGESTQPATSATGSTPIEAPGIPDGVPVGNQDLSTLRSEIDRLTKLAGLESDKAQALERISEKISRDEAELASIDRELESAAGAADRIAGDRKKRLDYYASIFEAVLGERDELASLYAPLAARLEGETGTLGKLGFSVRRLVDAESWTLIGEELLDLRKGGPFRGKGSLLAAISEELVPAWQWGNSKDVTEAISKFLEEHESGLVAHAPVDRMDADAYFAWEERVSRWLYSTSHIKVNYGVLYEDAEIEQLSPGTRGIVLLLLYLAIDQDDLRPLIIDQPEENLDPKSIFTELVHRFRDAKIRRQVILVTHNANLVVNTDADQVIVAKSGPHRRNDLPEISYISGGLDNPQIRNEVCEILEGGEAAFQERARRLRVRL
jgi:energy-coupling factor transporter ATP-binding protein EcfA2